MVYLQTRTPFGLILELLAIEDVSIFNGNLAYNTAFGLFCCHFIYFMVICFSPFWYVVQKKNLATL
jgi:hypothetical protein